MDSDKLFDRFAELATKGIAQGCGPDAYCPDAPVTRGQMATFLHRASGNAPGIAPSVNADTVDGLDSTQLGASGYEVVVGAPVTEANTVVVASATCPAGKKPVGGGGSTDAENFFITDSLPQNQMNWTVRWESDNDATLPVTAQAFVICINAS